LSYRDAKGFQLGTLAKVPPLFTTPQRATLAEQPPFVYA
jgi:hypothetical protein